MAGPWFTVIVIVFVAEQPFVPVTVYVVVTDGDAETLAPDVELSPEGGLHEYVVAPLAVSVVASPEQMAVCPAVTFTTGGVFVVTVMVCEVVLQPDALQACRVTV